MPVKANPKKLNPLQLKTLTLLQELSQYSEFAQPEADSGLAFITRFPNPHGNHFHLGAYSVAGADATGLRNEAVWVALSRKGLVENRWPIGLVLLAEGRDYDTGLRASILHGSDH